MTVFLGAHAFDVEPRDRSAVLAGPDGELVFSVKGPDVVSSITTVTIFPA